MNIQNIPNSTSFGCKLNTISVIESTTGKFLKNGNYVERIKLISNVLDIKQKDLQVLTRDPLIGFICFISSGKILSENNPHILPIIEKLKQIMKIDKTGETTNAIVEKIINKYGHELDLKI